MFCVIFFVNSSIPNKYYQAPQLWQPVPYSVTNLTRKGAARALLSTNKHPCLLPQPHPWWYIIAYNKGAQISNIVSVYDSHKNIFDIFSVGDILLDKESWDLAFPLGAYAIHRQERWRAFRYDPASRWRGTMSDLSASSILLTHYPPCY